MLLYLRTSKGDINTQNTGNRVNETVDGTKDHYRWAFPDSLEPYEIRKAQVEELGNDVGNMLLAVKVREDNDKETDIHIGIDGSFYQHGQRVSDVSDFPIGFSYLTNVAMPTLPSFGTWRVDGPFGYITANSGLTFSNANIPIYLVSRIG
jgi:hypothetical protein